MEDCERKYKEAFNMAVLEHKSDNEAVRESIERIFPQLKEPEDERIRKALISAINNICNGDEGLVTFNGFSKEQVLTWLEKQGESADKCEGCNNAKGCVACVDGSEWAHIEEHNPAWSKEDESNLQGIIDEIEAYKHIAPNYYLATYDRFLSWLKSLKDRVGCEVNYTTAKAWSEEDEINYNYALAACVYYGEAKGYEDTETHQKANSWLKSLKDRVGNFDDGYKVEFSAAKHNQWKPSDEQIKILSIYADQNNYHGTVLTSLYKDLKKLKGE